MKKRPELLAPAGDLEKLQTAFRYGADACYMGTKTMGMRMRIDDQGGDALESALKLKTELGKKIYLTMNVHAHEYKFNFLELELKRLEKIKKKGLVPDGILVSDPGVFNWLREKAKWLPLHVSTQANTLNSSAVEFWSKQGAERVVLGREVSLRELQQMRKTLKKRKVKIEIEGFVHGAMCMAYSGRCLLSNFMASRDANEGMCAHTCRWKYNVYLEEGMRPGQFIPLEEDDNGSYLMSSKDMCMVEHLKDLVDAGLDSMKIEGRNKTVYYLAIVTRAYREALDLAMDGKPPTPEIMDLVESINTRNYFTGFWYGKPGAEGQNYEERRSYNDNFCFGGIIRGMKGGRKIIMETKNHIEKGDKLEIITPDKNIPFVLGDFVNAETGESIKTAHAGQGFSIEFEAPAKCEEGFVVRKKL